MTSGGLDDRVDSIRPGSLLLSFCSDSAGAVPFQPGFPAIEQLTEERR